MPIPALVMTALSVFEALIGAFPQATKVVQEAKDFFTGLFSAGVITKEQQDALHSRLDKVADDYLNGRIPHSLIVVPDPE